MALLATPAGFYDFAHDKQLAERGYGFANENGTGPCRSRLETFWSLPIFPARTIFTRSSIASGPVRPTPRSPSTFDWWPPAVTATPTCSIGNRTCSPAFSAEPATAHASRHAAGEESRK